MQTLIAAVRTLAALIVVGSYILVCGPPVLIWTAVSRDPRLMYAAGGLGVRAGFFLVGIRLNVVGREHMQSAAVYACNHSSNVEPPAVFMALRPLFPRLRVLYKAELRKLPVLVWVFDAAGFVPLERGNPEQSRPAVDRAAQALRDGNAFVIFPEGTRSRTGELLPFKKGGFLMALKAQAPIVPVAVSGGRDAMRKGSPLIWPVTVRVDLGAPIPTGGLTNTDRDSLIEGVRESIRQRL
ncbi:MAG TPA: lysophospholipid acyltransferase family protein [Vicinamibacterales bacterium]|nr:lysophospholipid acyltransferase family protein [Vicinamibacterales bacterium]